MVSIETPNRIEPCHLENVPERIADLAAELIGASAKLAAAFHPRTAASLADLVRIMNTYYSNLIEGHDTRPRDIARALAGRFDADENRRNLQAEAAAHVRVQSAIDTMAAAGRLPEPASVEFIRTLHRDFYKDAPKSMLLVANGARAFEMAPGEWRSRPEHDNAVGRHLPPSSEHVGAFMAHFAQRYRFDRLGKASRVIAMATAHHRFNYIHPFPDGNGRVSRLMSHAMAQAAGVGAHGLWSVSRGLARGLASRGDYKRMMDHADMPRQGDLDGRGNLSLQALANFVQWFLSVCVDQVTFMTDLLELDALARRLRLYVAQSATLKPEAERLLTEALYRGSFPRGDVGRITGLAERTARRVLNETVGAGLLASETPKGDVSLRFTVDAAETLFPKLFAEA